MSAERATGLILRTRPLTETSLIVHWLTVESGRLATVAKGARRPKSPFRGRLDLFYEGEFAFQRSRRSTLHTLREVVLRETHTVLREDFDRLHQAAYGALLIEQVTEEETPVPEYHALMHTLLAVLGAHPAHPQTLLAFELKLLAESGLQPDCAGVRLAPEVCALAGSLVAAELAGASGIPATAAQQTALSRFLEGHLVYHLGRVPRGRAAALGLASGACPAS